MRGFIHPGQSKKEIDIIEELGYIGGVYTTPDKVQCEGIIHYEAQLLVKSKKCRELQVYSAQVCKV